jgi:hypothetical protein
MAISAKIDPNPPILRHYDDPGPDSPREPGDQPDQKLRSRGARKSRPAIGARAEDWRQKSIWFGRGMF